MPPPKGSAEATMLGGLDGPDRVVRLMFDPQPDGVVLELATDDCTVLATVNLAY